MPLLVGAAMPAGEVSATVTNLRSEQGQVLACLTARPGAFPDCEKDPEARTLILKAEEGMQLDFGRVPTGRYAIAIVHDENGNGRLDKRLMFPREGYGFSRNAPIGFGPPSFRSAAFAVEREPEHQSIKMRYLF
ncbi:hypothetical protein GCM10011371_14580 [Novosphingobium marinum]|uniref:Uncharacterized protein (DUF2141 family) n=2 Tax=Novosphingobium marinum TaxID=1514948 RepID=A0A7Z0BVV6_9SPHN|nr:DUF2141 domain-containing protein [Novosphingobium marinum]NYH95572.1 uncharacterized protein (DUF2141 family) [Novosphingobium marinum]GGC28141.1 hypothetical protein GCM10011371_14580 [Novosphingobium marinum]